MRNLYIDPLKLYLFTRILAMIIYAVVLLVIALPFP